MCSAAGARGSMALRSSFIVWLRYIAVRLCCQGRVLLRGSTLVLAAMENSSGSPKASSRTASRLSKSAGCLCLPGNWPLARRFFTPCKPNELTFVPAARAPGATSICSRGGREYGNFHARREAFRAINALGGFLVVRFLGCKNVRDEFLRVAVDEGNPGTLHLNHDAVAFLEHMVRGVQIDLERRDHAGRDRLRRFEGVAEAPP